jgi:hypothetical protein
MGAQVSRPSGPASGTALRLSIMLGHVQQFRRLLSASIYHVTHKQTKRQAIGLSIYRLQTVFIYR